jgi:hypothetical protein
LRLIFLIVTGAVSLPGLWQREWWWKDAEILMLRHQLAVAERAQPRAHSRLTWPDRVWLALLAGTVSVERLAFAPRIATANQPPGCPLAVCDRALLPSSVAPLRTSSRDGRSGSSDGSSR